MIKSTSKWRLISSVGLFALITLLLSSCGGSVSFTTAKLSDPSMAKAVDSSTMQATTKATVFSTSDAVIYCSVKLSNAPSDTEVKSQWIYLKGEATDLNNYQINETPITTDGTRYLAFSLEKPSSGWPKGDYVVKLLVDGKEQLQVPFKIQ
jgi:hypothetical protein